MIAAFEAVLYHSDPPDKNRLKECLLEVKSTLSKRALTEQDKKEQAIAIEKLGAICKNLSYLIANKDRIGDAALTLDEACFFKNEVKSIAKDPKPIVNHPFHVSPPFLVEQFLKDVTPECVAPSAMAKSVQEPDKTATAKQTTAWENIGNVISRQRGLPPPRPK